MKKAISIVIAVLCCLHSWAEELKISGVYQGENVYVMNPFVASGTGYTVTGVIVNGTATTDDINSSAFEIDLSKYELTKGDKIEIIIKHHESSTPKIVNPEVLKPQSTFTVSTIKVVNDNKLTWTTTGESGSLPFIVEQFRWNKWIKVATIDGKGTPGTNSYSAAVNVTSGYNRFRVKQIDYTRKPRYGKEVKHRSMKAEISYAFVKPYNEITFSAETMYELYNSKGVLIEKGLGTKINTTKLGVESYYLNFDTKTEVLKKK